MQAEGHLQEPLLLPHGSERLLEGFEEQSILSPRLGLGGAGRAEQPCHAPCCSPPSLRPPQSGDLCP